MEKKTFFLASLLISGIISGELYGQRVARSTPVIPGIGPVPVKEEAFLEDEELPVPGTETTITPQVQVPGAPLSQQVIGKQATVLPFLPGGVQVPTQRAILPSGQRAQVSTIERRQEAVPTAQAPQVTQTPRITQAPQTTQVSQIQQPRQVREASQQARQVRQSGKTTRQTQRSRELARSIREAGRTSYLNEYLSSIVPQQQARELQLPRRLGENQTVPVQSAAIPFVKGSPVVQTQAAEPIAPVVSRRVIEEPAPQRVEERIAESFPSIPFTRETPVVRSQPTIVTQKEATSAVSPISSGSVREERSRARAAEGLIEKVIHADVYSSSISQQAIETQKRQLREQEQLRRQEEQRQRELESYHREELESFKPEVSSSVGAEAEVPLAAREREEAAVAVSQRKRDEEAAAQRELDHHRQEEQRQRERELESHGAAAEDDDEGGAAGSGEAKDDGGKGTAEADARARKEREAAEAARRQEEERQKREEGERRERYLEGARDFFSRRREELRELERQREEFSQEIDRRESRVDEIVAAASDARQEVEKQRAKLVKMNMGSRVVQAREDYVLKRQDLDDRQTQALDRIIADYDAGRPINIQSARLRTVFSAYVPFKEEKDKYIQKHGNDQFIQASLRAQKGAISQLPLHTDLVHRVQTEFKAKQRELTELQEQVKSTLQRNQEKNQEIKRFQVELSRTTSEVLRQFDPAAIPAILREAELYHTMPVFAALDLHRGQAMSADAEEKQQRWDAALHERVERGNVDETIHHLEASSVFQTLDTATYGAEKAKPLTTAEKKALVRYYHRVTGKELAEIEPAGVTSWDVAVGCLRNCKEEAERWRAVHGDGADLDECAACGV